MILIWFLVFVVVLTLLVKIGIHFMGRRAGRHIAGRHRDAEHIIDTGNPPDQWPADGRLARLDELIGYFRSSPMVADEPTREFLLNELVRVRKEWDDSQKE